MRANNHTMVLLGRSSGVFADWGQRLLARIWPHRCVLCHAACDSAVGDAGDLCAHCEADLLRNQPACLQCARPLAHWAVCGTCQNKAPPVDASIAPLRYVYPLDSLVKAWKFNGDQVVGEQLGRLFAEGVVARLEQGGLARVEALLPVPLHRQRQQVRGFNQSEQLARHLAQALGVPVLDRVLIRERPTEAQSTLPFDQRRRNIRNAFRQIDDLPCRRVALVDDVITTGSTVNELARVLKRGGAERVEAWALARVGSTGGKGRVGWT